MEAPPDWDLLAVVRSCSSTTTASTTYSPAADLPPSPPPPPQHPPCHPLPQLTLQQQQEQPWFSPTTPSTCSSSSVLFGFSGPLSTTSYDLHDICQPLTASSTTSLSMNNNNMMHMSMSMNNNSANSFQSISCSPLTSTVSSSSPSVISLGKITVGPQQPHFRRLIKPSSSSQVIFGASSPTSTTGGGGSATQSQRTKKRKNLMKKVCHVPAEGLSNDMWAWRKYGQKPIKGSPYPRGYYRCSSSKGCLARKQVERNRSDPKMFIVTYTAEHNHPMPTHRNSLAGSTRQKTLGTTGSATDTTPEQQTSCSSPSAASLSPLTEEKAESKAECEDMVIKEEEDNDMDSLSDLILNDDFYVGFEQIDGGSGDSDCFSDQFSPSSEFPWLSSGSSSTATAAGGS